MGERIDELKGNVKQGVGKATGDTELEAEGETQHDAAKASRETKGVGNQIKGKVEEGIGKVSGDEEVRARGVAHKIKGDTQRAG
ncbi:MAG: CsbD family protein [Chloroflexi bacterium]|nr:CsbD family protein [Chloroflexota bacterium]